MNKIITCLLLCFIVQVSNAQSLWYENSSSTNHINFVNGTDGTFTTDETNPDTGGINPNATVSKFVRDGQDNPTILFNLTNPITDLSSYTISLKAHTSIQTADFNTTNRRIRLFFKKLKYWRGKQFILRLRLF